MFPSALPVIGKVIGRVVEVIDKMVEDKDLANKLKHDLEVRCSPRIFPSFKRKSNRRRKSSPPKPEPKLLQRNWRPHPDAHLHLRGRAQLHHRPPVLPYPASKSAGHVGTAQARRGRLHHGRSVEKSVRPGRTRESRMDQIAFDLAESSLRSFGIPGIIFVVWYFSERATSGPSVVPRGAR